MPDPKSAKEHAADADRIHRDYVSRLKAKAYEIAGFQLDALRRSDLGDEGFEQALPAIQNLQRFYAGINRLADTQPEALTNSPQGWVSRLCRAAEETASLFDEILITPKPSGDQPEAHSKHRGRIVKGVQDKAEEFLTHYAAGVALLYSGSTQEALGEVGNALGRVDRAHEELQAEIVNVRQVRQGLEQLTFESAAAKHAVHFHAQARLDSRAAKAALKALRWLVGCAGGIAVLQLAYIYFRGFPELKTPQALQLLAAKAFAYSLLTYAIAAANRAYRAARHNNLLNRHRGNALRTFVALVQATKDDPLTRNAILLQATHAIFTPQPTGFLGKDVEAATAGAAPQLVELMRGASAKSD